MLNFQGSQQPHCMNHCPLYNIIKKHSRPKVDVKLNVNFVTRSFQAVCSKEPKNCPTGLTIRIASIDLDGMTNKDDKAKLKQELCASQYFLNNFEFFTQDIEVLN